MVGEDVSVKLGVTEGVMVEVVLGVIVASCVYVWVIVAVGV
jgi:hypothetical protein